MYIWTDKSEGELDKPRGIEIDILYVSDSCNNRIALFTQEGDFLRSFGAQGSGPGQFERPSGIVVSNDGVICIGDCI